MVSQFDVPPAGYDSDAYKVYMASPEWQSRQLAAFDRWGGYCQGCLTNKNVKARHTTFQHFGHEGAGELLPLCNDCYRSVYEDYYNKGWYSDLKGAYDSFLKTAKRSRKKMVLVGHDGDGDAILRKKRFRDKFTWFVKLSWPKRALAILAILIGIVVAIPVAYFVLPTLFILFLVFGMALLGVLVFAAVFGVMGAGAAVAGAAGNAGALASAGGARVKGGRAAGNPAEGSDDPGFWEGFIGVKDFREQGPVSWKFDKTSQGDTIIRQDKVGATWAYKGDTFYKFSKTLGGETIITPHKW